MSEVILNVNNIDDIISLFGSFDENVNLLQRQYDVSILSRGNDIRINGDEKAVKEAASANAGNGGGRTPGFAGNCMARRDCALNSEQNADENRG